MFPYLYKLRHEPNMVVFDHPHLMMLDWDDVPSDSESVPIEAMIERVRTLDWDAEADVEPEPAKPQQGSATKTAGGEGGEDTEAAPDAYSRNCSPIWHCTSAGHQQVINRLTAQEGVWAVYKTFGGSRALRLDQPVPVPSEDGWEGLVRLYECDPLYVYQAARRGHWAARVSHKLDKDGNLRPEQVRLTHLVGEGVPHPDLVKLAGIHHGLLVMCGVGDQNQQVWLDALAEGKLTMAKIPYDCQLMLPPGAPPRGESSEPEFPF